MGDERELMYGVHWEIGDDVDEDDELERQRAKEEDAAFEAWRDARLEEVYEDANGCGLLDE